MRSTPAAGGDDGRVVLLGDLNGTLGDRAFAGVTSQLNSAQITAGAGFGFNGPDSADAAARATWSGDKVTPRSALSPGRSDV